MTHAMTVFLWNWFMCYFGCGLALYAVALYMNQRYVADIKKAFDAAIAEPYPLSRTYTYWFMAINFMIAALIWPRVAFHKRRT